MPLYMPRTTRINPRHHEQPPLSSTFARLSVLCTGDSGRRHALPITADFVGFGWTSQYPNANGANQRCAAYRCRLCGTVELYGAHFVTGKPHLLRTLASR